MVGQTAKLRRSGGWKRYSWKTIVVHFNGLNHGCPQEDMFAPAKGEDGYVGKSGK